MVPKAESRESLTSSTARVLAILRDRIRSEHYRAGEWLPAERLLAEDLHVHRRAIRAAVTQLAEEGLISVRPNCRPTVLAREEESTASLPAAAIVSPGAIPSSRFVALVMWHGGFEQGATAQQRIFWGMNQALAQAGYHGVFLDLGEKIGDDQENATREAMRLEYALEHDFGGIIFYAYAYQRNRELIQKVARHVPLVLIDRMIPGIETDFVGIDNYQAMYEATWHLIRQGHRRIVYVTRAEPIHTVLDRLEGYRSALREAYGADASEVVLTANGWHGSIPMVFDALFHLPIEERPTAVLCVNDYEAVRVAERLQSMGLSIPEDVALVGFDNIVQMLPGGVGLTTVAQPFEEIGRTAAQTFLRRLESSAALPVHIELPAQMVLRGSSEAEEAARAKWLMTAK